MILIEHELTEEQLVIAIKAAVKRFSGYGPTLESAIGAVFVGKEMGWRVLRLIHNEKTIRQYESILGLRFKVQMQDETPLSQKSYGFVFAEKIKSFSKLLRGEVSYDKRSYFKKWQGAVASSDE